MTSADGDPAGEAAEEPDAQSRPLLGPPYAEPARAEPSDVEPLLVETTHAEPPRAEPPRSELPEEPSGESPEEEPATAKFARAPKTRLDCPYCGTPNEVAEGQSSFNCIDCRMPVDVVYGEPRRRI